jgi:hypothetical protein
MQPVKTKGEWEAIRKEFNEKVRDIKLILYRISPSIIATSSMSASNYYLLCAAQSLLSMRDLILPAIESMLETAPVSPATDPPAEEVASDAPAVAPE